MDNKENKNIPYSIKLTKTMDELLTVLADATMVSKHDVVRTAISEYIQKNKEVITLQQKQRQKAESMKTVAVINRWEIKERDQENVPSYLPIERRFGVFAPDGRAMEENLLLEEAMINCKIDLSLVSVRFSNLEHESERDTNEGDGRFLIYYKADFEASSFGVTEEQSKEFRVLITCENAGCYFYSILDHKGEHWDLSIDEDGIMNEQINEDNVVLDVADTLGIPLCEEARNHWGIDE